MRGERYITASLAENSIVKKFVDVGDKSSKNSWRFTYMDIQKSSLSPLALQLLNTTDKQLSTLELGARQGLIELDTVVLPEKPLGDNNHLGFAEATSSGDTLILIHRRMTGHNPWGAGNADKYSSFTMTTTSADGGKTWTESFNIRDAMGTKFRDRGGLIPLSHRYKYGPLNHSKEGYKLHLNGIGTSRAGTVVILCNYGAFRSEDKGRTWEHLPEQFREDTTKGDIVYVGPRIVDHPDIGLCAFGNTTGYGRSEKFPNPVDGPIENTRSDFVFLSSKDDGRTWEKTIHPLPRWAAQYEPAALIHKNDIFILARDELALTSHLQIRVSEGKPVDVRRASMRQLNKVEDIGFDYNPVTKRFEAVRSVREKMLLDIWSIDPENWDSAEWRFEGTIFARKSEGLDFYDSADGFHPTGTVIDEKKGVQHIFIYSGHPCGPAGSFRITRTLDTPKLSSFLHSHPKSSS